MHLCRVVDARERWQALQAHLATARERADVGDHTAALQQVEQALAIDPDFLAAHSLKERLARADTSRDVAALGRADDGGGLRHPSLAPGLSAIEARVVARRAERKLAAATDAIRRRDFPAAVAALDEARSLNADPAGLLRVERALAERWRRRPIVTRGRAVAAATLLAVVFGARYLDERGSTTTAAPAPTASPSTAPAAAIGSTILRPSTRDEVITLAPSPRPSATTPATPQPSPPAVEHHPLPPPIAEAAPVGAIGPITPPLRTPPPPVTASQPATTPPPAMAPPAVSASPISLPASELVTPPAGDENGVREALRRYRAAYDQLNAASARAVWPAVDERALARAFDGLASQQLRFDACSVNVRGDAATADCRGTATYVPKVGSGDAQVQPLRWSFTLRKDAGQWAIQTADVRR